MFYENVCPAQTILATVYLGNWNFPPCWDLIALFFFPSSFVGWYLIFCFADLMAFWCSLGFSQWSENVLVFNRDWQVYKLFKVKTGSETGEQKAAVSLKSAV